MRSNTILQLKYIKVFIIFCLQHVHVAISNTAVASSTMVTGDPLQYSAPKMLPYWSLHA